MSSTVKLITSHHTFGAQILSPTTHALEATDHRGNEWCSDIWI